MQKAKPIAYSESALKSTSTHIYLIEFYFLRKIHLWGTRRKFLRNYTWGGPQAFFRQKYFCTKQRWVDVDFNADFEYAIGFAFWLSYYYENWLINAHFSSFCYIRSPNREKIQISQQKNKNLQKQNRYFCSPCFGDSNQMRQLFLSLITKN